ncbi:MAG: DUF2877 domain-containing protein [Anaerolineales bacterium]|nr:DUF2877 domain-containing protein [Anaerolineales bacterium]
MWSRGQIVIGATARVLLTRPGFAGGVIAIVTGAVYLLAQDCQVLWLAQNDLPMHARALRGDFDFGALRVGMVFQSDGASLQFDKQWTLEFGGARVWQPAAIDPTRVAPRETIIARARELDLTGFQKPVRSLADARDLIGLGKGLTPSGDDFVGGWLFAAHHLRAAYRDAFLWKQRAVDDLLEYARARTNVISYALLRDHARGQSVDPLHDWIAALLCGASSREIETHAQRVRAIGSTTGEALLAGALVAISARNQVS